MTKINFEICGLVEDHFFDMQRKFRFRNLKDTMNFIVLEHRRMLIERKEIKK